MSSFDAMLTTVPEDVREAIEEVCNEAGTFDADWCILKAAGELIAKSRTLPPVSPEDLVEGEWYVVKNRQDHGGKLTVAQCDMETMRFDEKECEMIDCDPYPVLWIVGAEFHFRPERFDSIYGPLRFKIGGAE